MGIRSRPLLPDQPSMSIPTPVFLDTRILDGQQYNFQSTALSAFVPACAQRSVTLLLPESTDGEISSHIEEWSKQAAQALEDRSCASCKRWFAGSIPSRACDSRSGIASRPTPEVRSSALRSRIWSTRWTMK